MDDGKEARPRPRHFSMLRDFQLADLFTLANAICGMASVLSTMRWLVTRDPGALSTAFGLLPFALLFDVLDGRIARWRQKVSMLGQELDSLADSVSFGVAPAVLAFALGMQGSLDGAVLVYFVACGISRLARYNATAAQLSDDRGKVRYFEGTPIPTSLALVLVMYGLHRAGRTGEALPGGAVVVLGMVLHPIALMFFASGCAMISKTLRIPKP